MVQQCILSPQKNTYRAKYISTLILKHLHKTVHEICTKCKASQFLKKQYGKHPIKEAETKLWDTLCIDLIGKY